MEIFGSTLRALAAPRRLLPILAVAGVLVAAQARFGESLRSSLVPLVMVLAFVVFAPASYRIWLGRANPSWLAPTAYLASGLAMIGLTGILWPAALGVGVTYLTDAVSLPVAAVLYLVGGWGLGRDIELELELEHTRVLARQRHLEPHFLYNTLNAIAEWCREDPVQAERAILRLSAFLEGVFSGLDQRLWLMERELRLVKDFVALQLVRDPDSLALELSEDAGLEGATIPPLALLELVENAIKHGPRKGHRGPLVLSLERQGHRLQLSVENPGPLEIAGPQGRGLAALRQRLSLVYGQRATLALAQVGERTRATLTLPLVSK